MELKMLNDFRNMLANAAHDLKTVSLSHTIIIIMILFTQNLSSFYII
jgi:hypothetical protein